MTTIPRKPALWDAIRSDAALGALSLNDLRTDYEAISLRFHSYFEFAAGHFHANALFHRIRYLDLFSRKWTGRVLDVGNDKPFVSYFLQRLNPTTEFETISSEFYDTPFDLHEVDIEREPFPFADASFDAVIFTEVIEHLWRDPSHCVFEIGRVLRSGGSLFLTTPNPCDRHSLVCVLWQANPNQRSGIFSRLESGHLHLWTVAEIKLLLEAHGFSLVSARTEDLYGHTKPDEKIERVIAELSPYRDLMNETIVVEACKASVGAGPVYPTTLFPDGGPVELAGTLLGFLGAYADRRRRS